MCITVFLIVSCLMFGKAYESFDLLEPNQCNATSYFDTLSHTCRDCGPMRIPSTNRLSCECRKGFLPTFNSSGRTDQCRRCEAVDLEEICAVVNLNCDVHDIKGFLIFKNFLNNWIIFLLSISQFYKQRGIERLVAVLNVRTGVNRMRTNHHAFHALLSVDVQKAMKICAERA